MRPHVLSNSDSLLWFTDRQCDKCQADAGHRRDPDAGDGCALLLRIVAGDDHRPPEWTIDADNRPVCSQYAAPRVVIVRPKKRRTRRTSTNQLELFNQAREAKP